MNSKSDEPKLPLTVPRYIWDAVALAVRPSFADSYLSGARMMNNLIICKTRYACDMLNHQFQARQALNELRLLPCYPDGARQKDWGRKRAFGADARQIRAELKQLVASIGPVDHTYRDRMVRPAYPQHHEHQS